MIKILNANQNKPHMLFPELSRKNLHGMAPTPYFFKGLYRRLTRRDKRKVFILGFHKTGTTSLARALQVLGYRVCGFVTPKPDVQPASKKELFELSYKPLLEEYDAFQDTLWFLFYKELAEMYPDAKFILTVRPEDHWYRSMIKHFGGHDRKIFHWIYDGYGDPLGNKELYIRKYQQHNSEVNQYLKNHDLTVMKVPEDFNWPFLCDFLECPSPGGKFPHANSASSRNTMTRKALDQLKNWYYRYYDHNNATPR